MPLARSHARARCATASPPAPRLHPQAAAEARAAALSEADRALGRGGVQSFALEGVLAELQVRWCRVGVECGQFESTAVSLG